MAGCGIPLETVQHRRRAMPKQSRPDDTNNTIPNQAANREPAEGSRETAQSNQEHGGITNRPGPEEDANQDRVPPRGKHKEGPMRNDARPVGHEQPPIPEPTEDSRDSVTHDRQSHVINQGAED